MLSKIEQEYLRFPESFNANYAKVLRHRIRVKALALQKELTLLEGAGFLEVMRTRNQVTEFRNGERSLNQAAFKECMVARERFELSSAGPKPAMLVHYTTGLRTQGVF